MLIGIGIIGIWIALRVIGLLYFDYAGEPAA
jgi:hypothetical protein